MARSTRSTRSAHASSVVVVERASEEYLAAVADMRAEAAFEEAVFDQSIQEFLDKKEALADYFDDAQTENIFAYIPQQKTSLVSAPPRRVSISPVSRRFTWTTSTPGVRSNNRRKSRCRSYRSTRRSKPPPIRMT